MYALHSQLAGSTSTISNLCRRIKWWHASTESECDAHEVHACSECYYVHMCARKRIKKREKRRKKEYSSLRSTSSFFMHRVVCELEKNLFFLQICSPLFFGKVSGSWFLRGRPKDKTRKRDKKTKKKIVRVMLEGDSSEQQLIVILSRMRGWDFIAWSFRGVWDSSWEEKVIPFLRESAFWESGLHSFISRLKGSWESECSKSCWEVWMSFPVHGSDIMRIFFAWFAHRLCMHLNIGIGGLILTCSLKKPSPSSFCFLVSFWFRCFLLVCCFLRLHLICFHAASWSKMFDMTNDEAIHVFKSRKQTPLFLFFFI